MAIAAFGFMGSAPVLAGVVVKSSGPSAADFPVGKKLNDASSITLREGDSVTVLTDSGTRVIRGAGTHRVGARGASKRTAFAMLTRQGSGARVRTGAVRGAGPTAASNPNLWNVDVTAQDSKMCLPGGETVTFWRADTEGEETWVLGSATSDFHVHVTFDEGDATASLGADELPLTPSSAYDLSGPDGGGKRRVEFVTLSPVPNNAEDLAVALAEQGCGGQLDLMSEKLAS
ncbi:hypothetical protein [Qipengyuania flava]|uniref:hypothetical protein n=1 Tax=Qipengyuania flava TaxID=192812 RepID=UPI001C630ACF|nr:hypothetical protein [Qipengyuania flava]QYJ07778.1 hypothetical protein KUV82_03420 [Qipengyuania flava]